ncbi:uncharacterized protein SAPINGB_P002898 [Magnusiomyces paraingens]|uniref:Actin-related protein 2/3 complex subunit 5 n=1 Tax=Magnusiomyces paraingens TaxID=2606893 RepID=A0A5E8BIY3_9ASCO|nr:uncharacterized protein SAPINGB_P002898 [Saprochaete ingens]VVT50842.1 unnamed protein product [Saprochaete ingens]
MAEIDFRRIDVDQYDPDRFLVESLVPPQPPVSLDEIKQRSVAVKRLLSQGDYQGALETALRDPPYGGSAEVKNANLQTVLDVLLTLKSNTITPIIEALTPELQDILIKYIYKGMGSPLGQTHGNGVALLLWFEKTVDITSQGAIIRYMSDRRTV